MGITTHAMIEANQENYGWVSLVNEIHLNKSPISHLIYENIILEWPNDISYEAREVIREDYTCSRVYSDDIGLLKAISKEEGYSPLDSIIAFIDAIPEGIYKGIRVLFWQVP